jgi:hypothetical protein
MIHGMGEQIPMDTLTSFVGTTWTSDPAVVDPGKPDPNTGGARQGNTSWGKPDSRNKSFELRRITTETGINGKRTDFYEYYWAHLLIGNTWAQVQPWVVSLIWRNPFKRVPAPVRLAWVVLVLVAAVLVGLALWNLWNIAHEVKPAPLISFAAAIGAIAVGWVVNTLLVPRFGDVARYVKASPPNVGQRQKIRENGVELLEALMNSRDGRGRPVYDRIIVAAHSLGTIVAYDILTHSFARCHKGFDPQKMAMTPDQPARIRLEQSVRAAQLPETDADHEPLEIDRFQDDQDAARVEMNKTGNPWIVSDFVTLGSPLTHAEFLMAHSLETLHADQARRVFPTCPPVTEYDARTGQQHFTYRSGSIESIGTGGAEDQPRLPHHAALFAYTRWTNLFSPHRFVLQGDLVSGPVAPQFGAGVRDIAVLPGVDASGRPHKGMKRGWVTHNNYWSMKRRHRAETGTPVDDAGTPAAPHHIRTLRNALRLWQK